jgi:DNA-binding Lrp family transcriptional regulator
VDLIDKKIVYLLGNNSRISFSSIGNELSLSEAAIRQRVKKMLAQGEIRKFTIETNFPVGAIVAIKTNPKIPTKNISLKLKKSNIQKVTEVTGEYSIFATLGTENMEQMNDLIEFIRSVDGVLDTQTFTILKEN